MKIDEELTELFCQNMLAKRWDKVGDFLKNLLEESTYENIDCVDFEKPMLVSMWVNALVRSNLYKTTPKGKYLFLKLIRNIWSWSDFNARWTLISCVANLFSMHPQVGMTKEMCTVYFIDIADFIGLSREEVLAAVMHYANAKTKNVDVTRILQ